MAKIIAVLLICALGSVAGMESQEGVRVNPIRKVVTMLQNMQKKIAAEGEKKRENV